MDWLPILVNLVVTGILLYIFQKIIDERSAKRLREFETKFSKLYERQSNIVDNIYRKLINIYRALSLLETGLKEIHSDTNKKELIRIAYHSIDEFKNYFDDNKLYLPEKLGDRIYSFFSEVLQVYSIFYLASLEGKEEIFEDKQQIEKVMETSSVLLKKIQFLIQEIETEFRKLIGN